MASAIDRVGVYRGFIPESGVGTTKKGLPQFVGRFVASKKWVEDAEEMKAFEITEPGWVDWSTYEQEITGRLVLMTDKSGEMKEIFHMDALRKALGWDGSSFASLGGTDWSKKEITFWVDENEYEGNISLQVAAIDDAEASANRSIRALDVTGLKDLDSKFAGVLKKSAAPAKAAAAPAKPPAKGPATPPKPVNGSNPPAAKAAAPATTASAPTSTPAPKTSPSKAPPKAPPKTAPSAPAVAAEASAEEWTQDSAWAHVLANKGDATDDAMAEKWIDASAAVAPGKDETTMTGVEWQAIATKTLELLAAG